MNSILEFFQSQTSPIVQALYAGLFTWIMTAIGASLAVSLGAYIDAILAGVTSQS